MNKINHILVFCVTMILLAPAGTYAQSNPLYPQGTETDPHAFGEILKQPVCFKIVNTAPYTVFGQIKTNYFIRPDGVRSRHRSNFHLKPKEEADVCTAGPFFEGRRLQFELRTLLPIFTCKTKLRETMYVQGKTQEDGTTKTWIDCF